MIKMYKTKEILKLVLNSNNAVKTTNPTVVDFGTQGVSTMTTNYRFNLNIPYTKFTKNCKIALQSFHHDSLQTTMTNKYIGVYIKNITNRSIYDSNNNGNGTNILSAYAFNNQFHYINPNIELNSIELNDGSFLNNGIDIYVEMNKLDNTLALIKGCITNDEWCMELLIYDIDEEEMIYQELSNQVKNTSLYPLQ